MALPFNVAEDAMATLMTVFRVHAKYTLGISYIPHFALLIVENSV